MAECSFARCQQERRLIKRELMKWSKDMLHIVGLERVAEEFMGRRKWKHYQEQLTRIQLNIAEQQPILIGPEDEQYSSNNSNSSSNNGNDNHCKTQNHRLNKPNVLQQHLNKTLQLQTEDFEINYTSQDSSATSPSRTRTPSPPPEPNDWIPSDKCNFCVNGRLLTVNAIGELVAETAPTLAIQHNGNIVHQHDSDSNSSASLHISSSKTYNNSNNKSGARNITAAATAASSAASATNSQELYKLLTQQAVKMTSMDSMAAQLALLADFNLINSLAVNQQHVNSVTPTTSEDISAVAISPTLKDTPSPSVDAPLDLSSKPSPNSSISGDIKSTRALSDCATPLSSARRTYSEEDLNRALQDVLANKLGTRKAASQYHVPRSTLRNKLYKIALDAKRLNARTPPELLRLQQELEFDEPDDSGEDDADGDEHEAEHEMERESNASTPHQQHYQDLAQRIAATAQLSKLSVVSEHNGSDMGDDLESRSANISPKLPRGQVSSSGAATAAATAAASGLPMPIDPNVLLHTLMLAAGIGAMPKLDETQTLGDLIKTLVVANNGSIINETLANLMTANHEVGNGNGSANAALLLQQQQQHQQQQQQQHMNAASVFRHRLPKSETPETSSSLDTNETVEDSILKIPSFKISGPASISPSIPSSNIINNNNNNNINNNSNCSSNRNGSGSGSPMLAAAVANTNYTGNSLLSPSPTSIQKMMASNIQRQINEQITPDVATSLRNGNAGSNDCSSNNNGGSGISSSGSNYKKPSISVAKIIGGTDTSHFGASPNLLAQHSHHSHLPVHHVAAHAHHQQQQQQQLSAAEAAALAAGKGTRPKRGKYRNYDRDSLVEAVKAVQRGEMSVHRAGSYYGVPHSTLEYKVKERHLMRPRKREPKPQPDLDGLTGRAGATKLSALSQLEKLKAGTNSSSQANSKLSNALKNNNQAAAAAAAVAAAAAAPNGLKLPLFDGGAPLSFQPNMFWTQTNAAANYGLDFNRMASAAAAAATANHHGHGGVPPMKSALEMAENMYDGIIRQTLQNDAKNQGNGHGHGNALLDQLLVKKTPLPFTNNRSNDYASICPPVSTESIKRSASPLGSYADIKRERLSGESGSSSDEELNDHHSHSNNNNNNNSDLAHNKNKSNNGTTNNNNNNGNGRSRMTSRDSETDVSSLKSEQSHSSAQKHSHHNNNKMMDLNGQCHSGGHIKCESPPSPSPATAVTAATIGPNSSGSSSSSSSSRHSSGSILHEKLAQIKAEQQQHEQQQAEEQL